VSARRTRSHCSSRSGCIPLAFAVGRSLFGRLTGLVCAALAALDPFLTYYAQETRMYSLEAFLSLVVTLAYVNGVLRGRRAWVVVFVLSLDAMLYVHNWALFLCVGLACATALFAARTTSPLRRCGGSCRCSLCTVGADTALAGAPHRRAMDLCAEPPRSRAGARRRLQR